MADTQKYFNARAWAGILDLQQVRYLEEITRKVNGIEAGATGDQSETEIEAAYNAQVAVVSQVIAETGSATDVYRWTPQRVAQAAVAAVQQNDTLGWLI